MKLSVCLHTFFDTYLPNLKGVSSQTIKTYRDTFTMFLPFAAHYHATTVDSLSMQDLPLKLVLAFLDHLEGNRHNTPRTRNLRLATFKSFAKMIRLMYPEHKEWAELIIHIPQKRAQKRLIGYVTQEEILTIFEAVDITKKEGFRDYTILHLLYDTGARASECATLNLDYFDAQNNTLIILGKGNCYRQISLSLKTAQLIERYISQYRATPKPIYRHRLFINQRGEEFTRYGIHRLCKKYLTMVLPPKRIKMLNAAHSFRHGCAVNRLYSGESVTDIKNRLGHESLQSTMTYLKLDISHKREIQKKITDHIQSPLRSDPKLDEALDWENKEKTLAWLDSL
jgi:integrase/recombinase XerD